MDVTWIRWGYRNNNGMAGQAHLLVQAHCCSANFNTSATTFTMPLSRPLYQHNKRGFLFELVAD